MASQGAHKIKNKSLRTLRLEQEAALRDKSLAKVPQETITA